MKKETRAYNFCAGPAAMPEPVLKRAREELLNWQHCGASVMEISHRSPDFIEKILMPAENNLRRLMDIPDNYKVLFVSTGASHQFAMVPLNLLDLQPAQQADYFHTGVWSGKAIKEAQRYGSIHIALSSEKNNFTDIDPPSKWTLNPHASYIHYTPNETVHGLAFQEIPQTGSVPLVADMSSMILSRKIDVNRFGLIYAGGQKNIGPSGLTIVIIREDLAGKAKSFTPALYNYQTYIEHHSLFNTPATFSIYLAGLCFEWLLSLGGVETIARINQRKAEKLYQMIDQTDFYHNPVNPAYRSEMNVIFYLASPELDTLFVKESTDAGLIFLKGHKLIGGIRASLYNAMPESGVEALIEFMKNFEKRYG
jgi:phosphoserine aminotransferase